MEVAQKRWPLWSKLAIIVGLLFGIFLAGNATYQDYEVSKTKRCVKVVGIKYYISTMFGIEGDPREYKVLLDGREILWENPFWNHLETDAFGNYCDYVYEKVKK